MTLQTAISPFTMHGGNPISSQTSQITTNSKTLSGPSNSPRKLIWLQTLPPINYHSKLLSAQIMA